MTNPKPRSTNHREACEVLDQELGKLPDKYRSAIVLCELEGRPRQEVADRLGIPPGTLSSRLAYARKLLAQRLTRRGVALPAAGLAALGSANMVSAGLVATTVKTCIKVTSGQTLAAAGATVSVVNITESVMRIILLSTLRKVGVLVLAAVLVGVGTLRLIQANDAEVPPFGTKAKSNDNRGLADPKNKAPATDEERLQGEWIVEKAVQNGRDKGEDVKKQMKVVIRDGRFVLHDQGKVKEMTFTVNPKLNPKHIDFDYPGAGERGVQGIYQLSGNELTLCWEGRERPTDFASDPDNGNRLFVLKRKNPKPAENRPAQPPAAQPPGEGRIMVIRDGGLASMNPDGKELRWILQKDDKVLFHPSSYGSLSPDGKRLALMVVDRKAIEDNKGKPGEHKAIAHVHVRDVNEKGLGQKLGMTGIMCSWSADGAKLLVTDMVGETPRELAVKSWIVDVKTKEKTALDLPENYLVTDWSRDGQWLLATVFEKAKSRLVMVKKDGSATYDVAMTDRPAFGKLSPDGKKVLYLANQKGNNLLTELMVQSLPKAGNAEPVRLAALNHDILGFTWSPDGRRVAYTCRLAPDPKRDPQEPVESFLVIVNADGTNMVTAQTEKGAAPLGSLEWR